MFKRLLCAALLANQLAAFELFLNSGEENYKAIKILHIRNKEPFVCQFVQTEDLKEFYKCSLRGKSRLISDQSLDYFDLKFISKKDNLDIYIYPKTRHRLQNTQKQLHKSHMVHMSQAEQSTDFTITFFPELQETKSYQGLDFSIDFTELKSPYIGALDLDQNPVNIADNNDINLYLSMKRAYENKEFESLLEQSERAIRSYEGSIFLNEFHLFRLRAMSALLDSNLSYATSIIEGGKAYIREFASSPNYAEVISLIIHSYLRMQQRAEAEYFIDILNTEQPEDNFTKLANLDYADYLIAHKKTDEAIVLYNNILFSTQDAELASKAAIALAKINIRNDRLAEAQEFVLKVFSANENYLLENTAKTISLADDFYSHKMYEISANLYNLVLKNSTTNDNYRERLEKNLATSLAALGRYDEAKSWLERYKNEYPMGEFSNAMDELADSLYFEGTETDSFKLHEYYRLLMAKYDNHIAARALQEETNLLFKERDYSGVYGLKDKIAASKDPALMHIYSQSLKSLLSSALHQGNCDHAIEYLGELDKSELNFLRFKPQLLRCLDGHLDFARERELAEYFLPGDEVGFNLILARLDFNENDYQNAIKKLRKILSLRAKKSTEELAQIYRLLALSYLANDEYNQAIAALKKLESYAPKDMQLVEVYAKFLGYFKLKHLNISAINYGQKAIDIQNRLGVNLYSPELEFITLEALFAQKKYAAMRAVVVDLSKLKLSAEQRTRMYYLDAQAAKASGDIAGAIASLKECSQGQWLALCQEDLSVLQPPEEAAGE